MIHNVDYITNDNKILNENDQTEAAVYKWGGELICNKI
jgi:hypothetical protein